MSGKFIALAHLDQLTHKGKVCTISGVVHTSFDGAVEEAKGWAEQGQTSYVAELQYEAYVALRPPARRPPPQAYLRRMSSPVTHDASDTKFQRGTW